MKTLRQSVERIKDAGVREKFIANVNDLNSFGIVAFLGKGAWDMKSTATLNLKGSFMWSDSPEGKTYWEENLNEYLK